MSATVTAASPIQQLITFALTFATLAERGAAREARSQRPEAQASAQYNRHRAQAFRLAADVFGNFRVVDDAAAVLDRWVGLRNVTTCQREIAQREAYSELLRHAERLQRA